jgi:hypothetical protein
MITDKLNEWQHCIDEYMERQGKHAIDEIEASSELARQGLMEDDQTQPGRPLREFFARLRDSNLLPRNIRQSFGSWVIRNSRAFQVRQQIFLF